jgi:mannose-6-phosphate isomerase-like protein (cupin superfamily)
MSYPAPTYHGEQGEVTARLRTAAEPPELPMAAAAATYLATGASTNGQFGLYRWDFLGPRSGPDPHFHRSISESFFILSGTVMLYDGARWVQGNPGDFLFVPEGGIHGFRNESGEKASMLLLFAPGAPREGYFEGLARLASLDDEQRAAFMLEHDTFWL